MEVDAWATALNVLGTEAGRELALKRGIPAMFIDVQGTELKSVTTPQFDTLVSSDKPSRK
jgi:thiamine biosynthesis lipoprotein